MARFLLEGESMFKQTTLIAASAVVIGLVAAPALAQQGKGTSGYLTDTRNAIIKDPYNLCWRTGYWTPAIANCECDKDLLPKQVCEPPPPPKPAAAPAPAPKPAAKPAPKPVTEKVTFAADVFFDFDKAVLKPEGKAKLDDLVGKLKTTALEVIIAIGHTDSVGSKEYNQKLSVRRAEAVKAHLVSKGIEPNRIYTEGKGLTQPIADNRTAAGRAKNRRVEIEVVGTRQK
jgi:OOP family OmpA-OmpF porin